MLMRGGYMQPRRRPGILIMLLVAGIAAEVVAPVAWKPSQLAGNAAARFDFSVMTADNVKQIELVEAEIVARSLAEREVEYGAWQGRCRVLSDFDAQLGALCHQSANSYYSGALEDGRRARSRLNIGGLK